MPGKGAPAEKRGRERGQVCLRNRQVAQWGAGGWAHVPRPSLPKMLDRVAWSRRVGVGCSVQGLATPIGTRLESSLAPGLEGRKASPGRAPARIPPQSRCWGRAARGRRTTRLWLLAPTPACCIIQSRLSPPAAAALTHSHLTKLSLKWAGS